MGQAVWQWNNDNPFGNNAPNENPSGLGTFTCNLRLPGQYFDQETNLHYNYFRDYDPAIGRYIQSDPIGLQGGVNRYAYVGSNPLSRIDPQGLFSPFQHGSISFNAFQGTGFSSAFAWQVSRDVVGFDFISGSQSIDLAHTHGMSRPNESPWDGQAKTDSFIDYQLQLCTPKGLAWALHAAQDKFARGHIGYPQYNVVAAIRHDLPHVRRLVPIQRSKGCSAERKQTNNRSVPTTLC